MSCPPGVYQFCSKSLCQVAFNLVFTVGGATNISGAVLCGVLVDSCGPRGGILTGLVLIMAAWMPKGWAALDFEWISLW